MANPFQVQVVNPLQALLLGQQSYASGVESNKKRAQEAARNEAGQLYAAGDVKGALNRLLMGGDLQGAGTYSGLDQQQYQRGRDIVQDARANRREAVEDRRWNASFGLQKRAADRADEPKPVFKEVTDPNSGATSIIAIDPKTMASRPIDTGIAPSAPNNPFGGGKFNEGQGKAAGFSDRMLQSEGILSGVGVAPGSEGPPSPGVQLQGASLTQAGLSKAPLIGNYLVGKDRQKYEQAKRDFINAQLRRESGAVISAEEFANADKQYFPVPGDERNPEIIQQKAANRRAAIEAMGREGGPSYRPKFNFDQSGTVVPYTGQTARKSAGGRRPISQKEYEALPRGSVFIAPDGTERIKP